MKYAIIGAGIGGLTTALAFERKGIDYEIFEKAVEFKSVGAGIWLAPNPLQVLEKLGVLNEIVKAGNSIDRITLAKSDLSPLSDNDQTNIKKKFGYSTIAIHRGELQRVILEHIPASKIHLNKGFKEYEKLKSGKLKVQFEDETFIEADYIIGADGINSKVRKQLFPESKTRYSGQTCWRGVADFEMEKEFTHRGIEMWGDGIRFGISKVGPNKVYWFAVANAEQNQKDKGNPKSKLLENYKSFHPLVKQLLENTKEENILRNDINDLVPLKNWYKDNICLIGDAGHATTPNTGQGGAQAIEDAHFLSETILNTTEGQAFNVFQEKRYKKVNTIVNQSWTTGKMAHWKRGKGLRNILMKSIPKSVFEKKMLEMYSIDY